MNPLIDELKQEHRTICRLFDEIGALGVESPAGREKLLAARELFMAHLEKEDREVHAVLARAERDNPDLCETMYLMHFNLKDVSAFVVEFFAKHVGGGCPETFAGDFDLIRVLMNNRIRREERVLFREFERVVDAS